MPKKAKLNHKAHHLQLRFKTAVLAVLLLVGGVPIIKVAACSTTTECNQQLQAAQSQKTQNQQALSGLLLQAGSYQDAIARLEQQINALQEQININLNTQAQLQAEIEQKKAEIVHQRAVLSEDIRTMYVDGQMSTIEELATSKTLSEYVDKQTYREAVQSKIQTTLKQIAALQSQLELQKTQVDALVASQQNQQAQLDTDRKQQADLLAMNESQQSAYNQQIQSNQSQISSIQAQLAALNTPRGSNVTYSGSCGGGYPQVAAGPWGNWGCSYAKDNTADNWGMYNRECVSYTAWRVHQEYVSGLVRRDMPNWGGVGDAYQWIDDANSAGIPVDQNPQPGDIAIRPASGAYGDVGHAMYVESVNSNGTINISQYNADYRGNFSTVSGRSAAGLYFLHFRQW